MKRFTGKVGNGIYEIILIDNSIALLYIEADGGWQAQKTEFRFPTPGFFSIEDRLVGDTDPLGEDEDEDKEASIICTVTEGPDGEAGLTVTLMNVRSRESVEWTFGPTRNYGPLYSNGWNDVLRDIVDGMETT